MKKVIRTGKAPAPIGPYNQAIQSGDTLYVSGQIALDPESGDLKTGNIREETHLVMRHLGSILAEAEMDYKHIVKCSIFIKNMDQFAQINEVYATYFEDMPPARETVEVARLPKDVNVEISAIAVR
jgi:2-iminobutanoate/2-iminopropanoate deaminase